MTIEKAIEILNANQHEGCHILFHEWELDETGESIHNGPFPDGECRSKFEAIAIAEKYERTAQKKSNLQRIRDNLTAAQKRKIAERVDELVLEELARRALEEE